MMRRFYAVVLGLAMVLTVPGLANAAPVVGSAERQQAIQTVIARALSQRGVPYTYGGGNTTGPTAGTVPAVSADESGAQFSNLPMSIVPTLGLPTVTAPDASTPGVVGFDASGLIQYAFAGVGIKMPRSSGEQYLVGRKVLPSEALPGDLMFFGPDGTQSVTMFVGNGQMVEATSPAVVVSPVRTGGMTPYLVRVIEW